METFAAPFDGAGDDGAAGLRFPCVVNDHVTPVVSAP
jgi:hypothetical protein